MVQKHSYTPHTACINLDMLNFFRHSLLHHCNQHFSSNLKRFECKHLCEIVHTQVPKGAVCDHAVKDIWISTKLADGQAPPSPRQKKLEN